MQTPSNPGGIALLTDDAAFDLPASGAHQRIVSYDLKEEGAHVLAVTLTYAPVPGSQRTFKKLYQFAAQQCIMVRTKAGVLGGGRAVLEAQLENLGEAPVMLDRVGLKSEWRWWGMGGERLVLRPREVVQVGFVLEWDGDGERPELGLLSIVWKTAGGERGFLRTGKLVLPGAA